MKKITNHSELVKARKKIEEKITAFPPYRVIELELMDGSIRFGNDVALTPKEAVRVAKWILAWYGDEPEEL
jgi:hypothetical protein